MIRCKKCEDYAYSHTWNEVSEHLKELHENSIILPDGTEVSNPSLNERIEALERSMHGGGGYVGKASLSITDDLKERIEKLEDHYRHSSENLANEVLSSRIEKLDRDMRERHVNLYERLEKLERPQMEHIKENRKNIIELAPQLLELGNHDIELRGRIQKLEQQLKDWPLWQDTMKEQIDNIIPESERIEKLEEKIQGECNHIDKVFDVSSKTDSSIIKRLEKLEDKMQGLMGVLEKLRDVVDKEMEEDG